ncbi:hypothetical protein MMC11_004434 [Xylographa trunciseda]|nr:hypothetical protein [Xylographa trunciseda]
MGLRTLSPSPPLSISSSHPRAKKEFNAKDIDNVKGAKIFQWGKQESMDKETSLLPQSGPEWTGATENPSPIVKKAKLDRADNKTGSTTKQAWNDRETMSAALKALSTLETSDHENEIASVTDEQGWVPLRLRLPKDKERNTIGEDHEIETRKSSSLMSPHVLQRSRNHTDRAKAAVENEPSRTVPFSSEIYLSTVESIEDTASSIANDVHPGLENLQEYRIRYSDISSLTQPNNSTQFTQPILDPRSAPQMLNNIPFRYDPQYETDKRTVPNSQYPLQQYTDNYRYQQFLPQYTYPPEPGPYSYVQNFNLAYQNQPDNAMNIPVSLYAAESRDPVLRFWTPLVAPVEDQTTAKPADVTPLNSGRPSLIPYPGRIKESHKSRQRSRTSAQQKRWSKHSEEAVLARPHLQPIEDVYYYSSDADQSEASEDEEYPERTPKWKQITLMSQRELKDFQFRARENYKASFNVDARSKEIRKKALNAFSTGLSSIFPSISDHKKVWQANGLEKNGLIWELLMKDLMLALLCPTASRHWTIGMRSTQIGYHRSQFSGLMRTLQRLKNVQEKLAYTDDFVPTMIIMLTQLGIASQTMATWCHKKRSGYALDWPMWELQNLCYRHCVLQQPKAHEAYDAQKHRKLIYAVFCAMNYREVEIELMSLSETRWTAIQGNRSVGDVMMEALEKRTTLYRDQSQISEPLFESKHLSIRALLEIGKIEVKWTFSFDEHLRLKNIANGKRVIYIFWDPSLLWIVHGCFDDLHRWPELVELKRTYAILFSPSRRGQSLRQIVAPGAAVSADIEASAESKTFDFYAAPKDSDINEFYYTLPAPPSIQLPDLQHRNASLTMRDCPSYLQAMRMHHEAVLTTNLNEMEEFSSYPFFDNRLREIQWYMNKRKPR